MKKLYITLGIIIVVVIAGYAYLKNNITSCYDGNGSGSYVTRGEFITKLNSVGLGPNDLNVMVSGLNKLAFESYNCERTDYMVRDGTGFKKVSQTDFHQFIAIQPADLVKVAQSGNSPYFVSDLVTGNNYFVGQKDGKYTLIEESASTASSSSQPQ